MSVLPVLLFPIVLFLVLWALLYKPLRTVAGGAKSLAKVTATRVMQSALGKWAFRQSIWGGVRPYAPMILVVLLGALAAFGAGFGFVELALRFRLTTSAVYRLDQLAESWFQHARQPGWTVLFNTFAAIGGTVGMWVLGATVTTILLLRKERASAVYVVVTILGGALLNLALKGMFARARPDLTVAIAEGRWYSFPSGHAMGSFISCGAVSYILMRQQWRWKVKSAALAAAVTMVVLVGFSRVYLGVHWASDIAGGWTAATVWLASTAVAYEMLLRLRQRKRGAEVPASPKAEIPDKPVPAAQKA
jgi:undecaprenyl-diphosphatase